MKVKKLSILIVLIALQFSAFGQRDRGKVKDKIDARKIAFLSDRLDLSPDEAQVFWPEYNMYIKEMEEVKGQLKQHRNKDEEIDENAAIDILNQQLVLEEKTLSIKKKYISKMKDIIGAKRTLTFFHSERRFKERLFESAKQRRKRNYKEEK